MYYDKKPTHIKKLTLDERQDFKEISNDYTAKEIEYAISGLFYQKTFQKTRLRPGHFLKRDRFEEYLDCWLNQIKLFEDDRPKNSPKFEKGMP